MRDDDRKLVYSTDSGWIGGEPKKPAKKSPKRQDAPKVPDDGVIRVARDNRRAGTMSVITGLATSEIAQVATALKKLCGSGGTAKNGVVEIQGDHRDKIVAHFERVGRRVKKAGG
ncbi:MAG: stress response translation initiation inhibitor YciH [Candidatus Eremiobacteraeota bacterium]|nr:stress response translation initiation inhibitor YciH [Candidatus Eremiobacteraeota bacterium]